MFCWYAQGCQSAAAELSSTKQQLPRTSPPSDFFISFPLRVHWEPPEHLEMPNTARRQHTSPMLPSVRCLWAVSLQRRRSLLQGLRSTKSFNQGVRAAPPSCFPLGSLRLRSFSFCGLRYRLCCSLDSFSLFLLVLCLRFYLTWF